MDKVVGYSTLSQIERIIFFPEDNKSSKTGPPHFKLADKKIHRVYHKPHCATMAQLLTNVHYGHVQYETIVQDQNEN